jgi:hypothetical protein
MPCSEPGRLVGGEAGPYEPSWGSFLDPSTLVQLPMLEDVWPPSLMSSCSAAVSG